MAKYSGLVRELVLSFLIFLVDRMRNPSLTDLVREDRARADGEARLQDPLPHGGVDEKPDQGELFDEEPPRTSP